MDLSFSKKGFNVDSFGTNSVIKMPGPSADRPNSYPFGTTYEAIYQDLMKKDANLYAQNGMLMILERNRKIKNAPQRFQETREIYDVIITCEQRCFDIVCEDFMERSSQGRLSRPVHVINFDIRDTPDDATVGARAILQLAQQIQDCPDIHTHLHTILAEYQEKAAHQICYAVHFY